MDLQNHDGTNLSMHGVSLMSVHVRWLIRRDMPEVLAIESQSFGEQWSEAEFVACLKKRNAIGCVAETEFSNVLGFMIYELRQSTIRILKFAVDSKVRRSGIGRQMADRIKDKLRQQYRTEAAIAIPDTMLTAHMFFAACGFICEEVKGDRYVFRYWIRNRMMKKDQVQS
jgi:ribosomal-protein-alanine N-acetyltransferase